MSTIQQVNTDYYFYVGSYIVAKSGQSNLSVIQGMQSGQYSFSLFDPGTGVVTINSWNIANITQPQISDLMAITPGSVQTLKKVSAFNIILIDLLPIFLDIYNRIGLLPKSGTLQTKSDLINLLSN